MHVSGTRPKVQSETCKAPEITSPKPSNLSKNTFQTRILTAHDSLNPWHVRAEVAMYRFKPSGVVSFPA